MSRSGFTSSTVRITSSNCVTSPRTTGAPIGAPANVAAPGFRSMPTTDSPRATSRLMSRGPMKPVAPITSTDIPSLLFLPRGLPGDHPPVVTGLRVDCKVADGEALLLAVPLHVHVRHAVDDADISVNARPSLARDGLCLRDQNHLIDPGLLVQSNTLDAAVRIPGDDDAPVTQGVGIHLTEGRPRRARATVE